MSRGTGDVARLADELEAARDAFLEALAAVAPESMTAPGLVRDWSGRDLVAHVGYWVGNAVETMHAVEQGCADEVGAGRPPTDEVNATVARIARQTDLATVQRREAASAEALGERLRALDAGLLDVVLPDGDTLRQALEADGADHYREHAAELRAALVGEPDA